MALMFLPDDSAYAAPAWLVRRLLYEPPPPPRRLPPPRREPSLNLDAREPEDPDDVL